jgi:hypothetical protein
MMNWAKVFGKDNKLYSVKFQTKGNIANSSYNEGFAPLKIIAKNEDNNKKHEHHNEKNLVHM